MTKRLIWFLCLCSIPHLWITGCNRPVGHAWGESSHFDPNAAACVFIPPLNAQHLEIQLTQAEREIIVRLANKTYSADAERVGTPMPASDGTFLVDSQRFFWIGDGIYREDTDGKHWFRAREPVLLKVWKPYSEAMLRKPAENFTLEDWQGFLGGLDSR